MSVTTYFSETEWKENHAACEQHLLLLLGNRLASLLKTLEPYVKPHNR